MSNVIELRPRAAKGNTREVLSSMLAKDGSGELQGSVCIAATEAGTEIHVLGTCADRLQLGVLALVKGLNYMCDQIAASGTAGHTSGNGAVRFTVPAMTRTLPKRLREASTFGDL